MASAAQTIANRANAQKSTGPRTPEGRAKVAQNAVKHGLLARAAVLQGEDPQEFAGYREQMLEELYPDGMLATALAERVVSLSGRLQRAARSQNAAFEALYEKYAADSQKNRCVIRTLPGAENRLVMGLHGHVVARASFRPCSQGRRCPWSRIMGKMPMPRKHLPASPRTRRRPRAQRAKQSQLPSLRRPKRRRSRLVVCP